MILIDIIYRLNNKFLFSVLQHKLVLVDDPSVAKLQFLHMLHSLFKTVKWEVCIVTLLLNKDLFNYLHMFVCFISRFHTEQMEYFCWCNVF